METRRGADGEEIAVVGSMLDALENAGVFSVEPEGDKVTLRESCDSYFYATLNKQEFGLLLDELKKIYDGMGSRTHP